MADKPPMHGSLSAAPSWFRGALFPDEIWGGSFSILGVHWVALLYKLGKLRYPLPQARTQKTQQHTTTNMSRRRPTHQRLWSYLSMATSTMDLDLGAANPYGSEAGTGCSVCSCRCRFRQLERRNRVHEKIERCARLWP